MKSDRANGRRDIPASSPRFSGLRSRGLAGTGCGLILDDAASTGNGHGLYLSFNRTIFSEKSTAFSESCTRVFSCGANTVARPVRRPPCPTNTAFSESHTFVRSPAFEPSKIFTGDVKGKPCRRAYYFPRPSTDAIARVRSNRDVAPTYFRNLYLRLRNQLITIGGVTNLMAAMALPRRVSVTAV